MEAQNDIKKGLAGVFVDTTTISKVMPETNSLTYRGYAVEDLCEHCSFEEVAYLLVKGELPDQKALNIFCAREKENRALSDGLKSVIQVLPKDAHPMDTLRTAVSYVGCEDDRIWDSSPDVNYDKFQILLGRIPSIIAACYRHSKSLNIIDPDPELDMSANFFYMCFGKVPEEAIVKALDASLILYAEHSFNASTFTARVVTSTTSDIYSAVTGAIGALKGPLHGGANEQVMHMLKEVGSADRAEVWMLDALKNKRKIMGFGHRVYHNGDSRVPTMTKYCQSVADITGGQDWMDISKILDETMVREKGIYPNLDFPAGPAYYMMGFEIEMFTPIFVMSRIAGWTAHIMEQNADNKLIRPLSAYSGVGQRSVKKNS